MAGGGGGLFGDQKAHACKSVVGSEISFSYDPSLNPGIINSFQTAAFRFGHSQINNVFRLSSFNDTSQELKDLYFRPDKLMDTVSGKWASFFLLL